MTKLGKSLIKAAKEAQAIARGEPMTEEDTKFTYDVEADCYYFYVDASKRRQAGVVRKSISLLTKDGRAAAVLDFDRDGGLFGVEVFGWIEP